MHCRGVGVCMHLIVLDASNHIDGFLRTHIGAGGTGDRCKNGSLVPEHISNLMRKKSVG